jgi:hypothetical protein
MQLAIGIDTSRGRWLEQITNDYRPSISLIKPIGEGRFGIPCLRAGDYLEPSGQARPQQW